MIKVLKNTVIFSALFVCLLMFAPKLEAEAGLTVQQLQTKFPNGAYWNHVVQSGHGYSNYQDYGPCNNPDGYTWSPCGSHNANVGIGGYDCNSFGNAMQCAGFAKKLAYDVYGSYCTSWGLTNINNVKPGDVIHYTGAGADATNGHWVFVIGVNGNSLTLGECNIDGLCKIRWGRVLNKTSITVKSIYSAPYALSDAVTATMSWQEDSCQPSDTDAYIYTKAVANMNGTYTEAGVTIWDGAGKVIGTKTEYINTGSSYLNVWYNITEEVGVTLTPGTNYSYQFYVVFNGTRYNGPTKYMTTTGKSPNPFTDVSVTDYFYDPVIWAVEEGITDGWTATTFAPNMGCTRGQVVTFLWRAAGKPKASAGYNPFKDVVRNDYYYEAVLWAVEEGITDGWTATTFAPDMQCTRGQIVTFLWRAAGKPDLGVAGVLIGSKFTDVPRNAYYYDAVKWALANKITDGWTSNKFAPDLTCTRGQVVTFLYRSKN